MSEERIRTEEQTEDNTELTAETLEQISGGLQEQCNKHSEQAEK
jgi:hypothetical protein